MLYFSKLRVFSVLIFTLIISYFTISNFTKVDDEFFSKNIKLGLDLQGGSYLLLEIDTGADASADPDGDLNVEGVDLKSVFNAELALDMTYLTDDVREIRKVAPNLDDSAAREVLQKAGFDLLAGLKAAEAAGEPLPPP